VSTGLVALLDDVASIAKVAAASLDDVAGQAAKAGAKSAGVVIDDAAVTPRYVVGFAADREIPIVARIAKGSLRNKLVFLLPAALLLSLFAPWGITPLLMLGGLYLCYEGAEKVYAALFPHKAHVHEARVGLAPEDPKALEDRKVAGAIRTDFILSAEIMAIALATIPDSNLSTQAIVLALVGTGITLGVYGVVALIVKADDFGVALASNGVGPPFGGTIRAVGRGLVKFMPVFLRILAAVGTAAMLWVGGGIIVHGLEGYGYPLVGYVIHDLAVAAGEALPVADGFVEWLASAAGYGVFGLVVGASMIPLVSWILAPSLKALKSLTA
jgi:predicted DNA repair protein MutK